MTHPIKLLFVAGDRIGGKHAVLQFPDEYNEIQEALKGREADTVLAQPYLAARRRKLSLRLAESRAGIMRFAGHGEDRHLQLLDDRGLPVALSIDDATLLFKHLPYRVHLVVLNTCHSLDMARHHVTEGVVDFAIGTEGALHDDVAGRFASSFYSKISRRTSLVSLAEFWAL